MAGSIVITGMSAGEPAGERIFGPLSVIGKAIVAETLSVILSSGDNTYTVPEESSAVLIIGPVNGETELKFRTNQNTADGGLVMNSGANPFVYVFPSTIPTKIILHAAGTSGVVTIAFI